MGMAELLSTVKLHQYIRWTNILPYYKIWVKPGSSSPSNTLNTFICCRALQETAHGVILTISNIFYRLHLDTCGYRLVISHRVFGQACRKVHYFNYTADLLTTVTWELDIAIVFSQLTSKLEFYFILHLSFRESHIIYKFLQV